MDCTLSENRKLDRKIAARKKSEMELDRRSDDDDDEDVITNLNVLMLLLFFLNRQFSSKNNKHLREGSHRRRFELCQIDCYLNDNIFSKSTPRKYHGALTFCQRIPPSRMYQLY